MKLCRCPDLHLDHLSLIPERIGGVQCCPKCKQPWKDMREPVPDAMQRFIDGDVILHWRDGYVNLIDVSGDKLMAKYVMVPC